ncbi:MAG: imidazole glycerol phosphate synthase subunit HisH [Chloroflexi bacterium]|nr:imidazole glycerol phosphate synthase subunit HisH [Chloroflexota bacterium]
MSQLKIAIVDYQAGNLRSVAKAIEKAGQRPIITSDPNAIASADALVFPGQGACDSAMRALNQRGLTQPIKAFIATGRPFLGVCLGLQLLFSYSEEGLEPGLGTFPGRVRRLPDGLKIPHMGWNQVRFTQEHQVFKDVPNGSYFYFVHSYYPDPEEASLVACTTTYGIQFCCAIARDNLVATQFHPEKSGTLGLKIYDNFIKFAISRS